MLALEEKFTDLPKHMDWGSSIVVLYGELSLQHYPGLL